MSIKVIDIIMHHNIKIRVISMKKTHHRKMIKLKVLAQGLHLMVFSPIGKHIVIP